MGGYDSRRFSKEFSQRTEDNLDFIIRTVHRDEKEMQYRREFIEKYQSALNEVDGLIKSIREDANSIPAAQKKGKNELKSRLFSIANKLNSGKTDLESNLKELVSTDKISNGKLYEVTQLLNSLMGIAVLPYEMHKDFFNKPNKDNELLDSIKRCYEYKALRNFIKKHGDQGN